MMTGRCTECSMVAHMPRFLRRKTHQAAFDPEGPESHRSVAEILSKHVTLEHRAIDGMLPYVKIACTPHFYFNSLFLSWRIR